MVERGRECGSAEAWGLILSLNPERWDQESTATPVSEKPAKICRERIWRRERQSSVKTRATTGSMQPEGSQPADQPIMRPKKSRVNSPCFDMPAGGISQETSRDCPPEPSESFSRPCLSLRRQRESRSCCCCPQARYRSSRSWTWSQA